MPDDAELELFRQSLNCPSVLERAGWSLDVRESTRRALKYRRGAGEIMIVNHDGRGWWDATGSAKGDVFNLVQHLDPSLNFGEVRKVLRGLTGLSPSYPAAWQTERSPAECETQADRAGRSRLELSRRRTRLAWSGARRRRAAGLIRRARMAAPDWASRRGWPCVPVSRDPRA